jgi:hypothetical protein
MHDRRCDFRTEQRNGRIASDSQGEFYRHAFVADRSDAPRTEYTKPRSGESNNKIGCARHPLTSKRLSPYEPTILSEKGNSSLNMISYHHGVMDHIEERDRGQFTRTTALPAY